MREAFVEQLDSIRDDLITMARDITPVWDRDDDDADDEQIPNEEEQA